MASLTSMKGFFFSWGSDLVNAEKGLLEGTRDRTLRERERCDAGRGCVHAVFNERGVRFECLSVLSPRVGVRRLGLRPAWRRRGRLPTGKRQEQRQQAEGEEGAHSKGARRPTPLPETSARRRAVSDLVTDVWHVCWTRFRPGR